MAKTIKPLGVWKMLGLHLVPGALITAFFFLTAPGLIRAGYPPLMALFLAILVILIPFELGFLLYQVKNLTEPLLISWCQYETQIGKFLSQPGVDFEYNFFFPGMCTACNPSG